MVKNANIYREVKEEFRQRRLRNSHEGVKTKGRNEWYHSGQGKRGAWSAVEIEG